MNKDSTPAHHVQMSSSSSFPLWSFSLFYWPVGLLTVFRIITVKKIETVRKTPVSSSFFGLSQFPLPVPLDVQLVHTDRSLVLSCSLYNLMFSRSVRCLLFGLVILSCFMFGLAVISKADWKRIKFGLVWILLYSRQSTCTELYISIHPNT